MRRTGRSTLADVFGSAQRAAMTAGMVRPMSWRLRRALGRRLGRSAADRITRDADEQYLSPPPLARTGSGAFNLRIAAYLLALRDALTADGRSVAQAEQLLAEALLRVNRRLNRPLDAVVRLVHPTDWMARVA